MLKQSKYKFLVCCTIFILCSATFVSLSASKANAYPTTSAAVSAALAYLANVQNETDGSISTFGTSAWVAMAINAVGQDPNNWSKNNGPSLTDYLVANKGLINNASANDVSRYVLAIKACNLDPRNVTGTNFVAILEGLYNNGQIGDDTLLTDDFWGIMALVSAGSANATIVQDSAAYIKAHQLYDGGWGYDAAGSWGSDVDDTAAGIMALRAAGEAADQSNITAAMAYLKDTQVSSGAFASWGYENSGSDSWVICAIYSLGQHPGQWTYGSETYDYSGNSAINHILTLQNPNGSFNLTTNDTYMPDPAWYTAYVITAFSNKTYPVNIAAPTVTLIGDFNHDGVIDDVDEALLTAAILAYPPNNPTYDLNHDDALTDSGPDNDMDVFIALRAAFEST